MIFLFKKRKIYLDCFTKHGVFAQDNPIQKACNFIPDWWKKLPNSVKTTNELGVNVNRATMKGCLGFIELYNKGLIVPLWSDLNFKVANGQFFYEFAHEEGSIVNHNRNQYSGGFQNWIHFKIICPWRFKEKTGVKFLITNCVWNSADNMPKLQMLNGVVNFKLINECNINGLALLDSKSYQYNLQAGTPLIQILPMSEYDVIPVVNVVNDSEWLSIDRESKTYKFVNWGTNRIKKEKNRNNGAC